jgi:hypothetical protein
MKRIIAILVVLAFLPLAAERARAAFLGFPEPPEGQPFAFLLVGDQMIDLSDRIVAADNGKISTLSAEISVADSTISLNATFNSDPFITFGATTTNLVAAPVTYAFLFGTPIVPDFYTVATSTLAVTLTNGQRGAATVNNSAIYPTYLSGYGTVAAVPTNLGVDLGTGPVVAPGQNFGTVSNTFAPTFYNNLEALLTYTQTETLSVASWTGQVTLNVDGAAVPEPSTLLLMGLSFSALMGYHWRRRRYGRDECSRS